MADNILLEKVIPLTTKIVKLHRNLTQEKNENMVSPQLLRSSISLGANVNEALFGKENEVEARISAALKDIFDMQYFLKLLVVSGYLSDVEKTSFSDSLCEIKEILSDMLEEKPIKE